MPRWKGKRGGLSAWEVCTFLVTGTKSLGLGLGTTRYPRMHKIEVCAWQSVIGQVCGYSDTQQITLSSVRFGKALGPTAWVRGSVAAWPAQRAERGEAQCPGKYQNLGIALGRGSRGRQEHGKLVVCAWVVSESCW